MLPLRVAAFQRRPRFDDVPGVLAQILTDLQWCDEQGVDLALFPECYLQGYGLDRDVLLKRAYELESDEFQKVLHTLAGIRTTLVLGVVERQGNTLYNTAVVVAAQRLLGAYRKTYPNERAFQAGHDFPVFHQESWMFGVNICNDANYSEAARQVVAQGARLLCYPLNNMLPRDVAAKWRDKSPENLRQRAVENACWVISADVVGEQEGWLSFGCSCVVNPDGQIVARAKEGQEGVVLYTLI